MLFRSAFALILTLCLLFGGGGRIAALAAQETAPEPAIAFAARVVGDKTRTRLIVDFNRDVEFETWFLAEPARLVITLPPTLFSIETEGRKLPDSLVSGISFGAADANRSQVVLALSGPASVRNAQLRLVVGEDRSRLIVELVKSDPKSFAASVRKPEEEKPVVAVKPPEEQRKFVVVVDPGHGGVDGGATGRGGTNEKEITLQFAMLMREAFKKDDRYQIMLTRDDDSFVSLDDRVAFARRHHADLFISLHADSLRQRSIRGATIYTLSEEGSDTLSRILARKQNRADLMAGMELPKVKPGVADILIDLTRRETEVYSVRLARKMVDSMQDEIKLIRNPHRHADFAVLRAPEVPSILLEMGYLSNAEDERLMASPKWQAKAVIALKKAVDKFFAPRFAMR
ncbi:probable N-acetylmuramoyl-l-alanine amidase amic transmembrane protein [Ahrensia sp. R2A130]|nr:probable N-acetylmuramoyl-l-alanine amidase amic transmembrane protein [Ahrensia sp. R2A130]